MSTFRKIMIASFTVLALGAAAHARSNGGGGGAAGGSAGGASGGGGEPGTVMRTGGAIAAVAVAANPNRPRRPVRPRRGGGNSPVPCQSGLDPATGLNCHWN